MFNFDLPIFTKILFLFGISLISTSIIIYIFTHFFGKIWLMDQPHKYPHEGKRAPIPYSIWVVLFINFALLSVLFLDLSYKKLIIMLVLWLIVTVVSFIDDLDTINKSIIKVHPIFRLLMQIWIGAIIWITSIKIWYVSNIFWWIIHLDKYFFQFLGLNIYLIPLIFTIIWYVVVFNSINWSDSIPWLTSWLVEIAFIIILILTVKLYFSDISALSRENSEFVLIILSILIPSLFIFWCFDVQKKFLIRDSWTMFLGFVIATLSIISGWKIATVATVLGVYLIDAFYVILMRLYNKKNPLKWDTIHHLHFRLGNMWFSKVFVRNFVYSLSFLFWIWAIFLDKVWKIIIFSILVVIVIFITKILNAKTILKNEK